MERGGSSGATMVDDLIFDLEANLSGEEEIDPDPRVGPMLTLE